jgi:AraC-like DNA-binding protein
MPTSIPVMSANSLTGVPELLRNEFGPPVERRALCEAGLTAETLALENAFVPETAILTVLDTMAREAGMSFVGLLLAPQLSIARFGTWGRYVLEGETLGDSLARIRAALPMHCSHGKYKVEQEAGLVWIRWGFPTSGRPGYANVAICAAGDLISCVRPYAGPDWYPDVIELDFPRPPRITEIEDTFRCRLIFDAAQVGVGFDPALLGNRRRQPLPELPTTLADVTRARSPTPSSSLGGAVRELVRLQIRSKDVSLDAAARAIGYGTRRLQRTLDLEGLSFREITRSLRLETAKELLTQTSMPLSEIGTHLGYASAPHFSRAFRRDAGCSPSMYRARFVGTLSSR